MEFGESPKQTKVLVSPISHRTHLCDSEHHEHWRQTKDIASQSRDYPSGMELSAYPNNGSTSELNSFVFPNTDLFHAVFGYMLPRYQTALIFRIPTWDSVRGVWGSMAESWMFSSELSGPKCFPVRINPKVRSLLTVIGRGWTMCEALDRMLSAVPNDIILTSMTNSIEAVALCLLQSPWF